MNILHPRHVKFFALVIGLTLLALLFCGQFTSAGNTSPPSTVFPNAPSQRVKPASCSKCAPPSSRRIYAPAIELKEAERCEIVLNSRSPNPIDVTPTFYTANGDAIVGDPVQLQPAQIRFLSIEQLMPEALRHRQHWGGLALSFTGGVMEVWAQITFHGTGAGNSIDETFNILEEPGSDTREAVWWMPKKSTAVIALGNTSNVAIRTTAEFTDGDSEDVDIPAGATKFIRRHREERETESVKLSTVGPEGSMRAMGFIIGDDEKFTSSIRFYDTKKTVQPNLYATNLRLKNTETRIVIKNTSELDVSARPRFFSTAGEQGNPVELASITLKPQQVADVDLNVLRQAVSSRSDLDAVSVQIVNSGAPGSLIGSAYSRERGTQLTYDVPLRDSGKNRNGSGSYPWRIDNDYSTVVAISNFGDQPARFQVELRYPGGPYSIKQRELATGETATFDLRRLRDEQQPDRTGKTLPPTLDRGQFHWSIVATPGDARIIGRAEVVSRSARVVSSYSCPVCCQDSGPSGGFDPHAYGLFVDSYAFTGAVGSYYDCYGNYYYGSLAWSSMWTNNTSVATVNSYNAELFGSGAGGTDVVGSYQYVDWFSDGMDCYQSYGTGNDAAPVQVNVPTKLLRFDFTVTNPGAPNGYGPLLLTTNTNNEVRDVMNTAILTSQCGAYRNLVYELVDQNGVAITSAYSITEKFSNYTHSASYASGTAPSDFTKSIGANQLVQDVMYLGKPLPNCLGSDDNESFNQTFVVTFNGKPYPLTTVNHISRGRFAGVHKVDIDITTQ